VRTLDPERGLGGALVVAGEKIAAVLADPRDAPAGARRIDLSGACVLPGFVDAHVHFPSWALGRRELRMFDCRSLAEAVARVQEAARSVRPGGWLRGRGWRDELWREKPDRQALDAVASGVRVALRAHDGHSLWLSSIPSPGCAPPFCARTPSAQRGAPNRRSLRMLQFAPSWSSQRG
jgi:predicted amidohydrolase YtcJ